jgi:hypothetical protein
MKGQLNIKLQFSMRRGREKRNFYAFKYVSNHKKKSITFGSSNSIQKIKRKGNTSNINLIFMFKD